MDYLISNIDCINAFEDGGMIIFLKGGDTIETDRISFDHDNGTFDVGYIFQ